VLKRFLSAAAVLALLANPIAIWAQAGACMQLCLESCNKNMMAAHNHAASLPNSANHAAPSATASASQSHHSHCDGMHQAAAETRAAQAHQPGKICHVSMAEPGTGTRTGTPPPAQPAHNQKPIAPCCQSNHNSHVMDAGVSPALLIGLLPENFALAQLHVVRQRIAPENPAPPLFISSPPFEPPRS
jgi:hypothetical protein